MSIAELTHAYTDSVETLKKAVGDMTPDQLKARPVEGKWSTIEVVAHISDIDEAFANWLKLMIATEKPALVGGFHNAFAEKLAYQERDAHEEIALIENVRKQVVRILKTMPETVLEREGVMLRDGQEFARNVGFVVKRMTDHILEHVVHIHDKRKALGLPDVSGN